MEQLRGVILSVESSLIDTNEAHARAWVDAMGEHGCGIPLATMRRMIGMGADQLLPIVADMALETPTGTAISTRWAAIFERDFLPHLRPLAGARELVVRLRCGGWRLVITGASSRTQLYRLLARAGIGDLNDTMICADDAPRGKPAPDGVQAALAKARLRPEETILLGDTPYDVEAADRAGVGMIALRCGGWGDADLAGALALYDDPAALLAHFDDSPLARRRVVTPETRHGAVFNRGGFRDEPNRAALPVRRPDRPGTNTDAGRSAVNGAVDHRNARFTRDG